MKALLLFTLALAITASAATKVEIVNNRWHINGSITYAGTQSEGLLLNVRMVNCTFSDRNDATRKKGFDADANTDRFIAQIPAYAASGVCAFTLCLQGGMPGYEQALNSAFEADGSLREEELARVARVIRACDEHGVAVILGLFYQRQTPIFKTDDAIRAAVVNAVRWVVQQKFTNVMVEIANEYPHPRFTHEIIKSPKGMASLIRLAKDAAPGLLITASGYGNGTLHDEVAEVCDFLTPHFNGTGVERIPQRLKALKKFNKPIVCNEDHKDGKDAAAALKACVENDSSYGLMLQGHNQHHPFHFDGPADDPIFYDTLKKITETKP